ncbi:unnamed protein product, partial [Rotaria magnacalcarata]
KLNETVNSNSQIVMKTTTKQTDFSTHHNSKFILSQYDDELSSEEEKSDQSSASNINCLSDAMEEVSDMVKSSRITNGKRPFTLMYGSRSGRKRLYMLRYGDSRCRILSFRSKYDRVTALFLTFIVVGFNRLHHGGLRT